MSGVFTVFTPSPIFSPFFASLIVILDLSSFARFSIVSRSKVQILPSLPCFTFPPKESPKYLDTVVVLYMVP